MTNYSSLIESDPTFVAGTFDAKDMRLSTLFNALPGLFNPTDFAATQRAAGANMSVDVAAGAAIVSPGTSSLQGSYVARLSAATNTGTVALTWPAADASNPRIDIFGIQLFDNVEDSSGTTGWKFAVIPGTAGAGATHQLEVGSWPAIPTGFLPLAAVRIPATATTITTANITNLQTLGGQRAESLSIPTAETTTSLVYTRLTTPDFVFAYVPTNGRLRVMYEALWKSTGAPANTRAALFINGNQLKYRPPNATAPYVQEVNISNVTGVLSPVGTSVYDWINSTTGGAGMTGNGGATADISDVATGMVASVGSNTAIASPIDIFGLPQGWALIETRFSNSGGSTLTVQNRRMWAESVG